MIFNFDFSLLALASIWYWQQWIYWGGWAQSKSNFAIYRTFIWYIRVGVSVVYDSVASPKNKWKCRIECSFLIIMKSRRPRSWYRYFSWYLQLFAIQILISLLFAPQNFLRDLLREAKKSQEVSEDELIQYTDTMLQVFDSNKDGKLQLSEMAK